jgi:diadenosine tetraphosphatase ApaH/serine/threonine PP2A family protein phosphatase
MRALIISDIHSNIIALETVLEHAGKVDAVWCLGDVVGYGPNPNECVQLLKEQPNLVCLLGNHDAAAISMVSVQTFNLEARQAVEWTQEVLTEDSTAFLQECPASMEVENVTLAHGSPRRPVFEYLLDTRSATENFEFFNTEYCFVGHSHLPVNFHLREDDYMARLSIPPIGQTLQLYPRAILNPGSVGQPRDRDPRAAYAIYDSESHIWVYNRVEYDIATTQERMREHNLPERHITRLESGW